MLTGMSILLQIVLYIVALVLCIALYFIYKYYISIRILMRYYEKQGITQSYYYPLIGKYKYISDDKKKYDDGFYSLKQFLTVNPDCKYSMTNLAHNVQIQLYDPDLIKQFYNSTDLIKHKFGVEIYQDLLNGFIFEEGKEHARKRKIISQAFHFQLLQSMIPSLLEIYDEFFKKIVNTKVDNSILLCQEIAGEAVVRLFFSNSFKNFRFKGKSMTENISSILDRIGLMAKSAAYAIFGKLIFKFGQMSKVQKDLKEIKNTFAQIIIDRVNSTNLDDLKHKQRKDLVDYLLENNGISEVESEEAITVNTIMEEFITFYIAGLDTVGHTLGMALYYFCIYPEYKQKLIEEIDSKIKSPSDINADNIKNMSFLGAFVNEMLRHYTVADQIFARTSTTDIQIGNLKIKKGTQLNIGNLEIHYNPKYYKDPQVFNPMRWLDGSLEKLSPFAFNPFSSGKHNCIGQHFAQLELKIGIIKFLQKFDFVLDPNYKMILTFSFLLEPEHPIPITFKERQVKQQ